jgi:hypothetical protein
MNFKKITAGFLLASIASMPLFDATAGTVITATDPQSSAARYAARPHLAYIKTGNQSVDDISRRGLLGLQAKLKDLTMINVADVVGVDIERDDISLFPMIYWPVGENAPVLSAAAQKKVQNYLQMSPAHLIVFDINNGGRGLGNIQPLRHMLGDVALRPLVPVKEDSTVNKTFFKTRDLRGTFNYNTVLVEEPAPQGSGLEVVTSVIIGENNWAAAWAATTLMKGSEAQEVALRAGVNFAMLAMTGNYKLDQADIMKKDGLPQLDKK